MTTTTSPTDVTRYLDQVRALLVDLPADEREELLDDLAVHLQEVRAETDEPLEQALGTPAAFTAELLASSGHAEGGAERSSRPSAAWSSMHARVQGVDSAAALAWVRRLLPDLLPGWWVLRAYLGVLILADLVNGVLRDDFPVPRVLGSPVLGLLAIAGAVVASVQLGRRVAAREGPRWHRLVDVAVVLGALLGLQGGLGNAPEYVYVEDVHATPGGLSQPDGTTITNLFAYDAEGRLLDGVLLYDQDGTPVVVTPEGSTPYTDGGSPVETDYRLDVNGAEVANAYPLEQRVEEWRGGPDGSERVVDAPVRPPAITTPRLAPEGGDTASSSATTTTSSPSTPSAPSTASTTSAPPTPEPTAADAAEPPPPPAPGD